MSLPKEMLEAIQDAVVDNHINEKPVRWTYDQLMDNLASSDARSNSDLVIHEYFEDWSTATLADHMVCIVDNIVEKIIDLDDSH